MIEEGTQREFKACVLEQLWVWTLRCGHKMISDADFRTEFSQLDRRNECPICKREQEFRALPENIDIVVGLVAAYFRGP